MDQSAQSPYTAFEALDCYDLIEWAGTQPWSTGRVGLSGVSYLASIQWFVAALAPPHLAAINPWEGWSDTYREVARHGGIPETCFWRYLPSRWGHSVTEVEDLAAEDAEHPLYDAFWASKSAPLERITVPAFVVASRSDQGPHTRGTLEGFKQIASRQKWLEVHGRKKWAYFYERVPMERLREFFDHFLLGKSTGVLSWHGSPCCGTLECYRSRPESPRVWRSRSGPQERALRQVKDCVWWCRGATCTTIPQS